MSWHPAEEAAARELVSLPSLDTVIVPRTRDIGGFTVRRALPAARRRSVGPFVFLDEMGPTRFAPGGGLDVRPHPHIGLATVTYLFAGEIVHRDSLGNVVPIRPGAVNWMTAGRGIAHSERTPAEQRTAGTVLHGAQLWAALPRADEETAPHFIHHGQDELPAITGSGMQVRLIIGALHGERSPVRTFSETLYADAALDAGASLPFAAEHDERAAYLVDGTVAVDGEPFAPGQLLVFQPGKPVSLTAVTAARLLLLGGAALDGPRQIWWNFVSSSADRIERAKADWKAGRFGAVTGESEFIPLPE